MSPHPSPHMLPSITRIADFDREPYSVRAVPRTEWRNGQYVAVEIVGQALRPFEIELPSGRRAQALSGDILIGALGRRAATLEAVGTWEDVGDDLAMDLLSMAGVIGKCTSRSAFSSPIAPLRYIGHTFRDERLISMRDFATALEAEPLETPTILIVGTSMDAGKTLAGGRLIRALRRRGLRVVASKLTGVGRYRDVLAMGDAGAEWIVDFVDAGLPSTVVPTEEFRSAIGPLFTYINRLDADVAVIEAGASPLEPYNGDEVVAMIGGALRMVVLCASDPYAACGVIDAFGLEPTFISGRATATTAGARLTARLAGHPALDLLDPSSGSQLDQMLDHALSTQGIRQ